MANSRPIHITAARGPTPQGAEKLWMRLNLWINGLFLLGFMAATVAVMRARATEGKIIYEQFPVVIMSLAALPYFLAIFTMGRRGSTGTEAMVIIVFVAVAMRVVMLFAPQLSGGDYMRYMWDGAVTAEGVNPYRHSPQQALEGEVDAPRLRGLAERGRDVLEGITHKHLRTIYPPVAQGLFAVAHWISPFKLHGWLIIVACLDAVAALSVLGVLRRAGLPLWLVLVYLWNPLLVNETWQGGHVDVAVAAFVAAMIWALVSRRVVLAWLLWVLAVGVKLWPAILVFFLVRPALRNPRRGLAGTVLAAGLLALLAVPWMEAFGRGATSGTVAYAQKWAGGAWAYHGINYVARIIRDGLGLDVSVRFMGRAVTAGIIFAFAALCGLLKNADARTLCLRMGTVILLMILLSPMVWPWYFLPAMAPAAIYPSPAVLYFSAALPGLYARWELTHPCWAVAVVHAPAWALMAGQWVWVIIRRRSERRPKECIEAKR